MKEGDDSVGIATTPTAQYRTRSVGTKHHKMHLEIHKASNGERAPREVMANALTEKSRNRIDKVQTGMRSRLSIGDPNSVPTILRYTAAMGTDLRSPS